MVTTLLSKGKQNLTRLLFASKIFPVCNWQKRRVSGLKLGNLISAFCLSKLSVRCSHILDFYIIWMHQTLCFRPIFREHFIGLLIKDVPPVHFVCVFVEELSRAKEVSTVAALDPLVRLPLWPAAGRIVPGLDVVAGAHLVRRGHVSN